MTDEVTQAKLDYINRLRDMNPDKTLTRRLNKMEADILRDIKYQEMADDYAANPPTADEILDIQIRGRDF